MSPVSGIRYPKEMPPFTLFLASGIRYLLIRHPTIFYKFTSCQINHPNQKHSNPFRSSLALAKHVRLI
ncbi:MAG: hypothetical protein WBB31_07095, partial [Saprospiraceae bacterium]